MKNNLAYQEELRGELIDGQFVAMSPRPAFNHNRIASNIYRIFANYLEGKSCEAIADGMDLYLTENDRFVPDVMVVCDRSKLEADGVHGAPDLVVEVLSPSSMKRDRIYKKRAYEESGVKEYWIVSPAEKSVEIYRSNGSFLAPKEVYYIPPTWMLPKMSEKERAEVVTEFQCSLYEDLCINMNDIFSGLMPE